ncbi:MAG: TetR family transcriptional regulator [Actinomycetota bacterium]
MTTDTEGRARRRSNARGRTTAAHLERVALELFTRNGYEATTVEAIAAEAGVSRRTFFHHYPSKVDVLWGDSFHELRRFGDLLTARPETDHRQALLAAVVEHAEGTYFGEIELLRFQVMRGSDLVRSYAATWEAEMQAILAVWLAERTGRAPDDTGIRAAATALEALRRFVVEEWARSGGEADVGELAAVALGAIDIDLD